MGHVPFSNQSHLDGKDVNNVRQQQGLMRIGAGGVVTVTGLEDEN